MQASMFATFHWLLHPVLLVSCHSGTQNRLSQAHTDTYTHAQVQDYAVFKDTHLGSHPEELLLAKTLSSRPLTVQSVKK